MIHFFCNALKTRTERFDAVIEPAQIADVALGYQA